MGYTEQKIHKSLISPGNNQFKVAYQLVVDHKRMLQDCKSKYAHFDVPCLAYRFIPVAELGNVQSFFATSPPPWNTTFFQQVRPGRAQRKEALTYMCIG